MTVKKTELQSGFTLVELLMGMLASAVLALTVGSMLIYAWMGWRQSNESVQMQRDTTMAMRVIAKEIRRTPLGSITAGSPLICTNSAGVVSFTKNGGNLDMQSESGASFTLVRDVVTSFNTSKETSGIVRVQLGLDTGSDMSTNAMVIYSRN